MAWSPASSAEHVSVRLSTLKKRAQFQRVRGGGRCSSAAFVLEGKARSAAPLQASPAPGPVPAMPALAAQPAASPAGAEGAGEPRFGFTITRKLGGAVVRNRMRRRLKAALGEAAPRHADPRFDYVVVAREAAFDRPFAELVADLSAAFRRVHETARGGPARTRENRRPDAPSASSRPGNRKT